MKEEKNKELQALEVSNLYNGVFSLLFTLLAKGLDSV